MKQVSESSEKDSVIDNHVIQILDRQQSNSKRRQTRLKEMQTLKRQRKESCDMERGHIVSLRPFP